MVLRSLWGLGLLLSSTAMSSAAGVSQNDLVGRWCGEITDYKFTAKKLDVTFHKGGSRVLEIDKITVKDRIISIEWAGKRKDNSPNATSFELDDNQKSLIQLPNLDEEGKPLGDKGPRRVFRRC